MSVLALIPARAGSKGIPGKNFRRICDSPINITAIAVGCALSLDARIVVSSDRQSNRPEWLGGTSLMVWLRRPSELAQDDTPMSAVVKHALEAVPGHRNQIILLLQPTQPLRTPTRLTQAIALLRDTNADSVVSVTPLPRSHSPYMQSIIVGGGKTPARLKSFLGAPYPATRQELTQTYRRDGTVYAFWRKTFEDYGDIYGKDVVPLVIPPEETCELDSEADWAALEQRYKLT